MFRTVDLTRLEVTETCKECARYSLRPMSGLKTTGAVESTAPVSMSRCCVPLERAGFFSRDLALSFHAAAIDAVVVLIEAHLS